MSDKTDYDGLCRRVERIDRGAADYLRNEAPSLAGFEYDKCLSACFVWDETPQGHDFWVTISGKLGNKYLDVGVGEKTNEDIPSAAKAAWRKWHEDAVADNPDADQYIPDIVPMWKIALAAGVEWAKARGRK